MIRLTAALLLTLSAFLVKFTSSVFIPDPEFDDYDTWLNRNRSIIMRKHLPPKANTSWEKYYRSWGMDYDEEMAKKELTTETANFIDREFFENNIEKNFTFLLYVHVSTCSNEKTFSMISRHDDFVRKNLLVWYYNYCGTKAISRWCDQGDRLSMYFEANHTDSNGVDFLAKVTFTCPISFYYIFLNTFREVTKESWQFTKAFYVTISIIGGCSLVLIAVVTCVLCEKRNRKMSRIANNEHWRRFRFTSTYHSFDIPDFDFPMTDPHGNDETPTISGIGYAPPRK